MAEPIPNPSDDAETARLAAVMRAAGHGAWDWNMKDRTAWYSASLRAMLGFDRAGFPDRFDAFTTHVHHEDAARLLGTGRPYVPIADGRNDELAAVGRALRPRPA